MNDRKTFAPIDARVLALDRSQNYSIDERHKPFIARIEEIYLYDKNERTHCCEFTPSYYLIYLYTRVIPTQAGDQLKDHEQDEIFQAYELEETDNCYVHCHEIDALEARAKPNRFTYYAHGEPEFRGVEDDFESEEAYHDVVIEALREHFQANCPI
jgi:hypothetical protein